MCAIVLESVECLICRGSSDDLMSEVSFVLKRSGSIDR